MTWSENTKYNDDFYKFLSFDTPHPPPKSPVLPFKGTVAWREMVFLLIQSQDYRWDDLLPKSKIVLVFVENLTTKLFANYF